jgi:hypothetical protein
MIATTLLILMVGSSLPVQASSSVFAPGPSEPFVIVTNVPAFNPNPIGRNLVFGSADGQYQLFRMQLLLVNKSDSSSLAFGHALSSCNETTCPSYISFTVSRQGVEPVPATYSMAFSTNTFNLTNPTRTITQTLITLRLGSSPSTNYVGFLQNDVLTLRFAEGTFTWPSGVDYDNYEMEVRYEDVLIQPNGNGGVGINSRGPVQSLSLVSPRAPSGGGSSPAPTPSVNPLDESPDSVASRFSVGDSVSVSGLNLSGITSAFIGNRAISVLTPTPTGFSFKVPRLKPGWHTLQVFTSTGFVTVERYLEVVDPKASTFVVPGFAINSPVLTESMKQRIRTIMTRNPEASTIDITGVTMGPVRASDRKLALDRARATRAFIRSINPDVKFSKLNIRTEARPVGTLRQVVIRVNSGK